MNKILLICFCIIVGISIRSNSQSIVTTVHNMSVSGPGTIKATTESEICIFCHTPHNSRPDHPLWNRNDPGSTYVLYNSSTTQATIGQPDGSAVLCLSCHDGTIALGNVLSRTTNITFASGITTMPAGKSNLTTDLANDHPVSFVYNSALASADGELKDPSTLTGAVKLENSKMQCTSCHDPHKNLYTDFLVANSLNSEICLNCHQTTYWTTTSHKTSTKTWNGTLPDPWLHTPATFTNVAQNACENCHNPHSAATKPRLMNFTPEENNCLDCHNANVAAKNIQAQFAKTNKHNIYSYTGVHDPMEANWVATKHVECEDCHNPHAASSTTAVAPFVNGFNAGVKGINQSGNPVNPVQFEYEICYRCHSGNPWSPAAVTPRVIVQNNTRLEFAPGNPSFHSVAAVGVNTSVPSLIAPWTITSRIYCSDCHASDGASSPAGPHGSTFPRILKLQYSTANNTTESATAYALCYSCHSRTSILSDVSFKEHSKHIQGEKTPCNACHDPHGISSSQGNSINNSNLINFWTGIMTPSPGNGAIRFEDQGLRTGRCFLTCHGENHDGWNYP